MLLGQDCVAGIIGFNDLTADEAGAHLRGLPRREVPSVRNGGRRRGFSTSSTWTGRIGCLRGGLRLTNGLGFSPDNTTLYHSDSLRHRVGRYEVGEDGGIGEWRDFAAVENGIPDGLAVAEDGSVWVAVAHGGEVLRLAPDGSLVERLPCPHPMPTSVCFGGDDLRVLYVVTGTAGTGRDDSGTIYRLPVDVPGLPVPAARVAIATPG